jgi:hypothetical protein
MHTLAYRLSVDHPHPQRHPTSQLLYGTVLASHLAGHTYGQGARGGSALP